MADVQDYELLKGTDEPSSAPVPGRPAWPWLLAAALLLGVAVAVYFYTTRTRNASPAAAGPSRAAAKPATQPLGAPAAPIEVPPLDQSDGLVRELVKQVTSHPRIAAWLATDRLIRSFTVGIENIADAMASIDAAGAARLYGTLKPRIEEAYRDLGYPDTAFDQTLERAIVSLLKTPVPDGSARLEPKGIGYAYVEPSLEGLTPAQKQLLRTGPRNVPIIQASLRKIAIALGIPAERLPLPGT